jgi:hypothetical protein
VRKTLIKHSTVEESGGQKWAFLTEYTIYGADGSPYIKRWRIVQTPLFAVMIHKISRPDSDRDMHDHPWPFYSFVLSGGYSEIYADNLKAAQGLISWGQTKRTLSMGHGRLIRRGQFHKITTLFESPTWSIVFTGKRSGTWGFATPDGFVDYKTYLGEK